MRTRVVTVIGFLVCLAIALPMVAQQRATPPAAPAADAISGTWTGDWGPSAADRNQVSVELKFDGKSALTGTVKTTGAPRPDVTLVKSTFTPATGAVHMEADTTGRGGAVHFIIEGKLTGTTMAGSWNHDAVKGDFKLTKSAAKP